MRKDELNQPGLDRQAAEQLLDSIFEECEVRPNNVPMEALSAYTEYRSERFRLQKIIAVGMMVLFLLLPVLFIRPGVTVSEQSADAGGRTRYKVEVHSLLPVYRVTAVEQSRPAAVTRSDNRTYLVDPDRNGIMKIAVTLINRQTEIKTIEVTGVPDDNTAVLEDEEVPLAAHPSKKGPDPALILVLSAAAALIAAFFFRNRETYRLLRIRREGYKAEDRSLRDR